MDTIRKVPLSAAAQWLLDGFAMLKDAPLRLGGLGLIYGLVMGLLSAFQGTQPLVALALQLVLVLLGPLLMAGIIWGAREVQQRHTTSPEALTEPVRRGRAGALLAVLLPQVGLGLLMGGLFFVIVGRDNAAAMVRVFEQMQANPEAVDPALMSALPAGSLMAWLVVVLVLALLSFLATFVALPDVLFGSGRGMPAMRRSFKACWRNLPAVLLFLVLAFVVMVVVSVLANIIALLAGLVAGPAAAALVASLVMSTVAIPVLAAAMLRAWQDMLGVAAPAGGEPDAGSPVLVA